MVRCQCFAVVNKDQLGAKCCKISVATDAFCSFVLNEQVSIYSEASSLTICTVSAVITPSAL